MHHTVQENVRISARVRRRLLEASGSGCFSFVVRLLRVDIASSALKHGGAPEDIEHAVRNAMVTDELDDDLRLYLGPSRSSSLLEVIVLMRGEDCSEIAIHAMPMREKYRRLLPKE